MLDKALFNRGGKEKLKDRLKKKNPMAFPAVASIPGMKDEALGLL